MVGTKQCLDYYQNKKGGETMEKRREKKRGEEFMSRCKQIEV